MQKITESSWNQYIKNGYRIFVGSGAACPQILIDSFLQSIEQFQDLELVHILTLGESKWSAPKYRERLRINAFFLGAGSREAVREGRADYTPCFLSEIPSLFRENIVPIDVAFIQVSPPDQQGFCSLGVSVDVVSSAVHSAKYVIAQINEFMPRTFGQSFIHKDQIDAYIEGSEPIISVPSPELDEISMKIGKYVSLLIEDGSTLQMGIGKIPDATLQCLNHHSDLGIHTEMFTNGLLSLYDNGNITNKYKGIHTGKTITSFCFGNHKLYNYIDNNPHIEFHPSEYVNNPAVIAQNNKMIAINSAIEVDLTGQVVSDSVGSRFYSGIGGQVDFIRGAGLSKDGKPIIALPSTAKNHEISKIVPFISEGAGVVTSRGDVHYVVTEYGIATLRGRSIRERVLELIQVAHPKFREALLDSVKKTYKVPSYQKDIPVPVEELGEVEWVTLQLKREKFLLRPIHPSDQTRLQQFFYSHQKSTIFQRHRSHSNLMGAERAYKLVNIDQQTDLALCIVERQGPREIIHAVGRYYLKENKAEVAFVVREEKRDMGMASILLENLIAIAKKRKVERLVVLVRSDNGPMRQIVKKFGFQKERSEDLVELIYSLSLLSSFQS